MPKTKSVDAPLSTFKVLAIKELNALQVAAKAVEDAQDRFKELAEAVEGVLSTGVDALRAPIEDGVMVNDRQMTCSEEDFLVSLDECAVVIETNVEITETLELIKTLIKRVGALKDI